MLSRNNFSLKNKKKEVFYIREIVQNINGSKVLKI